MGTREYDPLVARFGVPMVVTGITPVESSRCRSGEVLQGLLRSNDCEAIGRDCTPRTPLGATMVSGEGACAAYYADRRLEDSR